MVIRLHNSFSFPAMLYNSQQEILTSPWRIQINNGKGIKKENRNGGTYMQAQSFVTEKSAFIQLTDMDFICC